MKTLNYLQLIAFSLTFTLISCGGLQTFNEFARAGDTVAIPAGMQTDLNKNNIAVTITPSAGPQIIVPATDPSIRAVVNFYPDPVSSMIVSRETGQDLTPYAIAYANQIEISANNDKDWYQTSVFIDLPGTLPEGLTQVEISNGLEIVHSSTLEIISGIGSPHSFNADIGGTLPLDADMLDSLARVSHYRIDISAATIPYAVEINMAHDPDALNGGNGKAFAINPLGYKKNLSWTDDGINMKAIMLPSENSTISSMQDYKFYIAGGISNLGILSVAAYDINGNVVGGVTATVTERN